MLVSLFIVPVVVLGTEIVIQVLVVVHVLVVILPVVVNHRFVVSTTELIVGATSQLWVRICMPDHEVCG